MTIPETIWAARNIITQSTMWWDDEVSGGQEYARSDIADARVAAAYEAAAVHLESALPSVVAESGENSVEAWQIREDSKAIRALTPADAKAALEAVLREALKDAAKRLMQMHREHMADLESDPDNYVSAYYTASIELRALIDKETTE